MLGVESMSWHAAVILVAALTGQTAGAQERTPERTDSGPPLVLALCEYDRIVPFFVVHADGSFGAVGTGLDVRRVQEGGKPTRAKFQALSDADRSAAASARWHVVHEGGVIPLPTEARATPDGSLGPCFDASALYISGPVERLPLVEPGAPGAAEPAAAQVPAEARKHLRAVGGPPLLLSSWSVSARHAAAWVLSSDGRVRLRLDARASRPEMHVLPQSWQWLRFGSVEHPLLLGRAAWSATGECEYSDSEGTWTCREGGDLIVVEVSGRLSGLVTRSWQETEPDNG